MHYSALSKCLPSYLTFWLKTDKCYFGVCVLQGLPFNILSSDYQYAGYCRFVTDLVKDQFACRCSGVDTIR